MYSLKCLLVYRQGFFYLLIVYIVNVKHIHIFYYIILDSKSVRNFVTYREHVHFFKNLQLIYLVLAASISHICVHSVPNVFYSATIYFG